MTSALHSQFYIVCANEESKFEALCNLYGVISIGQAMVFCQVRSCDLCYHGYFTYMMSCL